MNRFFALAALAAAVLCGCRSAFVVAQDAASRYKPQLYADGSARAETNLRYVVVEGLGTAVFALWDLRASGGPAVLWSGSLDLSARTYAFELVYTDTDGIEVVEVDLDVAKTALKWTETTPAAEPTVRLDPVPLILAPAQLLALRNTRAGATFDGGGP